jgi:hypothetical protein
LPADHSRAALRSLGAVGNDPIHSRDRGRLPSATFVVASSLDLDVPKAAPRLSMAYHIRLKVQPTAVNNALYRPNNARHFALSRVRASHGASTNVMDTDSSLPKSTPVSDCLCHYAKETNTECRRSLCISLSQRKTRQLGIAIAILATGDISYAACSP